MWDSPKKGKAGGEGGLICQQVSVTVILLLKQCLAGLLSPA